MNMIEIILISNQSNISLTLPAQLIGKKIRILMYAFDEIIENSAPIVVHNKVKNLRGLLNLTAEQSNAFHEHIETSRNEWERTI
jgi:hypothetical protein